MDPTSAVKMNLNTHFLSPLAPLVRDNFYTRKNDREVMSTTTNKDRRTPQKSPRWKNPAEIMRRRPLKRRLPDATFASKALLVEDCNGAPASAFSPSKRTTFQLTTMTTTSAGNRFHKSPAKKLVDKAIKIASPAKRRGALCKCFIEKENTLQLCAARLPTSSTTTPTCHRLCRRAMMQRTSRECIFLST